MGYRPKAPPPLPVPLSEAKGHFHRMLDIATDPAVTDLQRETARVLAENFGRYIGWHSPPRPTR